MQNSEYLGRHKKSKQGLIFTIEIADNPTKYFREVTKFLRVEGRQMWRQKKQHQWQKVLTNEGFKIESSQKNIYILSYHILYIYKSGIEALKLDPASELPKGLFTQVARPYTQSFSFNRFR